MRFALLATLLLMGSCLLAEGPKGYYRFPAIKGDTLVFTAEGDLWTVPVSGGTARRLSSHPGEESRAAISPDGKWVAFNGAYEGFSEIYTMPLEGGLPTRQTFEGGGTVVAGWTPEGCLLYTTRSHSGLPDARLIALDLQRRTRTAIPLAQAAEGCYDGKGKVLFFTRFAFQGSQTKRYKGGTAQNLWRFDGGTKEAQPLTADFPGTSKNPMWWKDRVYFLSDRDGTMNLWSMDEQGKDLHQHTSHKGWDIQSASLAEGRVSYQLGADLRIFDIATGQDIAVPIVLATDLDQRREKWIRNPMEYLTSSSPSPSGDRVVLTARGQVFVAPVGPGRLMEVGRAKGVRYRNASFMPDGKSILALSDASGEVELWTMPANGVGEPRQLTKDGKILRWEGVPSPDGKWIAHRDKDQQLWILNVQSKEQKRIVQGMNGDPGDLRWSPDSRWLAYVMSASNNFDQIHVYSLETGSDMAVTSDRFDSGSPAWSADGKWMYFLSDRNLQSSVDAPWGKRGPEPNFDHQTRIYHVALTKGLRSPFQVPDELSADSAPKADPPRKEGEKKEAPALKVEIDFQGLPERVMELPVPPGNYSALDTDGKRLYWLSAEGAPERKISLKSLAIENQPPFNVDSVMEDLQGYQLSADRKKLMVRRANDIVVFDAGPKAPADLSRSTLALRNWSFVIDPKEEWRQMFIEAWRLERDYFYDRKMHHLDWPAIRDKYLPLVDRVTDRAELSNILAQMIAELSTLHMFVRGGDFRSGGERVEMASLGAELSKGEGGWRVDHVYLSDPDLPEELSPLARPGVDVKEGDLIESINGMDLASVQEPGALLRNQSGKQVLIRVKPKGGGSSRDLVVVPFNPERVTNLRYHEWEYTRRLLVEKEGQGRIGYVHLRAMGAEDIAQWYRDFYPVVNRQGLILDARHNRGGNVDSWVLEKLMRKVWHWWSTRVGQPNSNMQDTFRGHIVVLCDESTASDGEILTEGIRRLGLGKIIGTRTWGGEVWLTSSNTLVDRGIATAAEFRVYGPDGDWLIEGHGVDPDIVVDNLPHATFKGEDAQLEAAIKHLMEKIAQDPRPVPLAPVAPDMRKD